jgi:hypothetical protein
MPTARFVAGLLACGAVFAPVRSAGQAAGVTPELPTPSGSHRIGTRVLHLRDPARGRELMVQLWYPTADPPREAAPYVPDTAVLAAMRDESYYGQPAEVLERWRRVKTHAAADASPSGDGRTPLLFSHGLGVSRSNYTALAEELASHGYIVATIDHHEGGFTRLPDGRAPSAGAGRDLGDPAALGGVVADWVRDASFVLHRLRDTTPGSPARDVARRVRRDAAGMLGHSLGGAAALDACLLDRRFRACANLDGAPFGRVASEGFGAPALVLRSDPDPTDADLAARKRTRETWERMGREIEAQWAAIEARHPDVPAHRRSVRGTGHMSFSDAPFVMPETITRFGGRLRPAAATHAQVAAHLLAFFGRYLRDEPGALLDAPGSHSPPDR